jgi:hypothetical protein
MDGRHSRIAIVTLVTVTYGCWKTHEILQLSTAHRDIVARLRMLRYTSFADVLDDCNCNRQCESAVVGRQAVGFLGFWFFFVKVFSQKLKMTRMH